MSEQAENTRLVHYERWKVRQVADSLLSSTTPVGVINALMARAGGPGASPFERYAGFVLRDAGAAKLAELPAGCTILISPPSEARLARLTCTSNLNRAQQALVIDVENAINRLCAMADAIEDSGGLELGQPMRTGISMLGAGFIFNPVGYHSALVKLPAIGRNEQPGMAYFNEVDWRVLDHIATTAHSVFQSSVLPNMHQAFMGASGPDGSDWDVRTRLATILETLELPLRYEYAFDVNVLERSASVKFTVPPTRSLPLKVVDGGNSLAEVGSRAGDAHIVYAIRMCCLLAAALFGSGKRLERAFVTGVRPQDYSPVITCTFDRKQYVYETLTAIDSRALFDPRLRFDTDAVARMAAPAHLEFAHFDGTESVEPVDDRMQLQRIEPHLDERLLPDEMGRLFHARRICDIDTRHYHGGFAETVSAARADSEESAIAAIAHLERVVSELRHEPEPPDAGADARPLYCSNPLSRAVVSLLDDDRAVGAQAEAFLQGDKANTESVAEHTWYYRAPDALFHAHMGLSDLYERLGDIRGAEDQADRCIELAPTTASAYFRKSDVLAQQARYAEAANLLLAGLRYAVSPRDCALLYYHLALILWNVGRKSDAVAVHVYTASLAGEYADRAAKVVSSLRKRDDSPVIAYASPLAATREMARARIPIAPSDAARTLVVKAAVGLSCAGAPLASAPYAAAIASYFRDDRVVASTCRSLIHGTNGTFTK